MVARIIMPAGVRRRPGRHERGEGWDLPANGGQRRKKYSIGIKEIVLLAIIIGEFIKYLVFVKPKTLKHTKCINLIFLSPF